MMIFKKAIARRAFLRGAGSAVSGAGGSTRDHTIALVTRIQRDEGMCAMAHLTAVAATRDEIGTLVDHLVDAGIENILALGGDPPVDSDLPPGELTYASELVELIRSVGGFSIGVAAHPEGHPRSTDLYTDRRHLADKLELADFAICQFFFEAEHYFRMVDELAALGVELIEQPVPWHRRQRLHAVPHQCPHPQQAFRAHSQHQRPRIPRLQLLTWT